MFMNIGYNKKPNKFNKKSIVSCLLILSLVFGSFSFTFADEPGGTQLQEEIIDEITLEPSSDSEYDGYIISVDDPDAVNEKARARTADVLISDETCVVENPEDVLKFTDADNVWAIEPNYKVSAFADPEPLTPPAVFPYADPADPIYRDPNGYQWGLKYINVPAAWRGGYRGKGITVAVLDSGLNETHDDINNDSIIAKGLYCPGFVTTDDNGHGSFVTSILAAKINNLNGFGGGIGMAGITDEVNIISYKVLNNKGEGFLSGILKAYNDLLSTKVDVVNLSFGHNEGYLAQEDYVIQKLIVKGVIIIAAAGNDGDKKDYKKNQVSYPAAYANVIGVGSVDSNGKVSSFSTQNYTVDILAPGSNMAGIGHKANSDYKVGGNGTSFATPVVAASAVIARQIIPGMTARDFYKNMKGSAKSGILNIGQLITRLESQKSGINLKKSILVMFNANGGKLKVKHRAVFVGDKYGTLPTPARKGYTFKGWYTKKKSGSKITSKKTVKVTANQTIYAHWVKQTKVRIKFNATGGKVSVKDKLLVAGNKYGKLPKPTRSGYTFKGWYTKKKGGVKIKSKDKIPKVKTKTLYAHWKKR